MSPKSLNLETRINTLNTILKPKNKKVETALRKANGNWSEARLRLKEAKLSEPALDKVDLVNSLADWSEDNVPVVSALVDHPDVSGLRDVALHFNIEKLAALVDVKNIPANITGADDNEKKKNFAVSLRQRLFTSEATAVLRRMVDDIEIPISDINLRAGVAKFLANQPDFNIRTTSIYKAIKQPDAMKGVPEEFQEGVISNLKILQRVQALSPIPEAIPVLIKASLHSALQITQISEESFMSTHRDVLGEDVLRQVYTNAINVQIRNEHALIAMREAIRGSGLAIMDGSLSLDKRVEIAQQIADKQDVPLNLEDLFGSMDYCECNECTSVYSPAAYFVELLQYLRNNNLDPDNPHTDQKGIKGTPLEKLFFRRPDLGCLELTCENTNTILPYVDLVNEVMESFIANSGQLDAFNVEDETSSELLAQPQHTNYQAYCALKHAVYPFTLPYHQPIDAIRIFLKNLGTSRYELLDTYRTAAETCEGAELSPEEENELQSLHQTILDRAVDAEFLGLTQEEYVILTKEALWPKQYFEITKKTTISEEEYQRNIGVREVYEYYGYSSNDEMCNLEENSATGEKGLAFVKEKFLPRTGIQYTDLVELLKTESINLNYPRGKALTILESLRFSYRFLQTMVDPGSNDPKIKYARLISYLENSQPWLHLLDAFLHPDPCKQQMNDWCAESKDLRNWVYCYFERAGKLIVLESAGKAQWPKEYHLFISEVWNDANSIGRLLTNGTLVDKNGKYIGAITSFQQITWAIDAPQEFRTNTVYVVDPDNKKPVYTIHGTFLMLLNINDLSVVADTCDLGATRLVHLDGTALATDEYDRIHRFIRLWRKMGWTINETDKAIRGLAAYPLGEAESPTGPGECGYVGFETFTDDCFHGEGEDQYGCPDLPKAYYEITPDFLHQLVAVRKLLDLTGLPLEKLLTFWSQISTAGDKSLYSRLFLTHNLLGIDKVFQADALGNYLAQEAKITAHIPVLMAALRLKADDITSITTFQKLPDLLTISTVSVLYRYGLLAKVLHVKVADLPDVIALFGELFKDAHQTLKLFETWEKMENAGFTFRQLNYILQNHDDPLKPLAPAKKAILRIAKTLFDGLNTIDHDHPDLSEDKKEQATTELIRTKAGMLFEQAVVDQIVNLLEGTTVYTTNAPADQSIKIPDLLMQKIKYTCQKDAIPPQATIQVVGILTEEEQTQAKAISTHPDWPKAIDRVKKPASNFYNDVLFGIFPDTAAAQTVLLAGDVNISAIQSDPTLPEPNTAPKKRFYFLKHFLPFLRHRLAHRLIIDTLSGAVDLPSDVADTLLSDVLVAGTPPEPAMNILEKIKEKPATNSKDWKGYLIPSADEAYTLIATSDSQPAPLLIDGVPVPFIYQQEDPSNVWSTDPTPKLKSGKLYWLEVVGLDIGQLQWKTATSPKAAIPASSLLPDYSSQGTEDIFTRLFKAALLVNGFVLSADEVGYLQHHLDDFDSLDFNVFTLGHWRRLQAYTALRDSLPKIETNLLDLFRWAGKPDDVNNLTEKIAAVALWKKDQIDKLLQPNHFNLNQPGEFCDEKNLTKLQKALSIADKIGMDVDRLFEWAKPTSKFWVCHQIAEDIRKALRARYDQEDWEKIVKPLNDQLRENQKKALISYLLVQQILIDWGVVDADSLFEFFLIDVQMDPCRETSRIKQAISTVQLFVQRCMLGLEEKHGVPNMTTLKSGVEVPTLDRDRWEWMQRYRVWEANRKVFLYPENWIEPSLRDDKSPFYKELESELLQRDISKQTVEDALKNYLFKVDEVANLKVVGFFVEPDIDKDGKPISDEKGIPKYIKLHIFARTRNAPHLIYYRYFDIKTADWYPWERVQVDIPSYDVDDKGIISENGTYLIPVVLNKRLLIFFPQFAQKTKSVSRDSIAIDSQDGGYMTQTTEPSKYWEIKMAWSEYRNRKWTQKQVSAEAVYDQIGLPLRNINGYQFVPRLITTPSKVVIDVIFPFNDTKLGKVIFSFVGVFHFTGSQLSEIKDDNVLGNNQMWTLTNFHYSNTTQIHSLQANEQDLPLLFDKPPQFTVEKTFATVLYNGNTRNFYHSFAHILLGRLMATNLDTFFDYYLNNVPNNDEAFGADTRAKYSELKEPYSLYNWEAAFHAPMLCVDRLLKEQQYEQALKMCNYVFNPLAKGKEEYRYWQFRPFREIKDKNVLESILLGLQAGHPYNDINEWRDKPFQPHVLARQRPSAYMKWVVMKYLEILIAYGDYYFRQRVNLLETMPLAIQCYVLAAHIYGPPGQKIPRRGKIQHQTYLSLLDKWDAFSNAMVELELAFPFSNQTSLPLGVSNGTIGLANIFGFASTLYFCIPDNPELREIRNTIDDRLSKIRHCQDIEGVFYQPPLFEPPIEPGLLVKAAAQGLSLASVLNDMDSPMPNYRFNYLLQKALELCAELKSMGNAFLSVKEKRDSEALSQMRAKHESSIYNLVMEVKKQQLEEAQKSLEALQQNRKVPVYRLQYYLRLIGEDLGKVPDENTNFSEVANQIEQPIDESGLKLIRNEKEEMDKASEAADWQQSIGAIETLASTLHVIPSMEIKGHPWGVGVSSTIFAGTLLGNAAQAVARGLQIRASDLSFQSTSAGRKGGFLRQLQDRIQQANIAGYEIKNIDRQILTQQIRIDIANREITNQQKQIDNAQGVEEFLRNKYTNEELYSWMEGEIRTLYYQAYTLAYDWAKKAEKTYCFERGLTTSNFIQFGYWDSAHDGLMVGERLYIGLKQLESAYQEKRGHDFEITRAVSLRQINPLALIQLKQTGICEFALPEILFDMDYPGHYMRRIKSVALTIPCVLGPYTSVNCTLRLLEHKFRLSSIAKDANDYPEKIEETDERFSTVNVPITSIAVSTAQNDNGVFELNFKDERYIPFEGAGAISKWRLELPAEFRQFDYETISDVIVHVRYTSVDGGDKLKTIASKFVLEYIKTTEQLSREDGLFALFDLKQDFSSAWYKAMQPAADAVERILEFNNMYQQLPIFTKGHQKDKIKAVDVYLFNSPDLTSTPTLIRVKGTTEEEFAPFTGKPLASKDNDIVMDNWRLKIPDTKTEIERLWMVVRYVLK